MRLSDPYLKVSRAKEHLDSLGSEFSAFVKSNPCEFWEQIDTKNQRYRIRIKVTDPPVRLSVIAGDVFFCLRAFLDQLVWALSTNATHSYAENTQFPILEKRDDSLFTRRTIGVPAEALALIESLQPYHGPNEPAIKSNLLWRLNKLCNIDKHRRIPLHGAVVEFKLHESIAPYMTFDDDQTMSFPLARKGEMTLYPQAAYGVVFGDATEGVECNVKGIDDIYKFIADDVIPRFAGFFE
jgi:hypothetical protein